MAKKTVSKPKKLKPTKVTSTKNKATKTKSTPKNNKPKTSSSKVKVVSKKHKPSSKLTKKGKTISKNKPINKTKSTSKTKTITKNSKIKVKSLKPKTTKKAVIAMSKNSKTKANNSVTPAISQPENNQVKHHPEITPYNIKENEEYMNEKQLEHFKTLLLKWKNELLHGAELTVQDMQTTSANFPDPVDRASQEEEFSLELRTRDRERKLLKKIEETLINIKENNYGYCNDCGAEIGIRRLEARPTATQCIECKTIAEIREKQIGEVGREKEEE